MRSQTPEWVEKAEGDFHTMEREARARKEQNYDGLCFHAQQCAEKYLKARLYEAGIRFPKIHDLERLLNLVLAAEPLWAMHRQDLDFLSGFSTLPRYPGAKVSRQTALDARARCRAFRKSARLALGLKP